MQPLRFWGLFIFFILLFIPIRDESSFFGGGSVTALARWSPAVSSPPVEITLRVTSSESRGERSLLHWRAALFVCSFFLLSSALDSTTLVGIYSGPAQTFIPPHRDTI